MRTIKIIVWGLLHFRWPKFVSKVHLKIRARNPVTFNQKILRRMSEDPPPLFVKVAGRLTLRDYVAECLGEDYLPKLVGSGISLEELDWKKFPFHKQHNIVVLWRMAGINCGLLFPDAISPSSISYFFFSLETVSSIVDS